MARWYPIQYDFSGGAVSTSFINRQDLARYRRSLLRAENWMPTLTGSLQRTPGTRFVRELSATSKEFRILPYLSQDGRYALITLSDAELKIILGLNEDLKTTGLKKQILANPEFKAGPADWVFTPDWGPAGGGDELGCRYIQFDGDGALQCACRLWKYPTIDNETCVVKTSAEVDVATDRLQFQYRAIYRDNFGGVINATDYTATIKIGTTDGGDDIGTVDMSNANVGTIFDQAEFFDLPAAYTGPLFFEFTLEATEFGSTPEFVLDRFAAITNADAQTTEETLVSPFLEADLEDIQFVQSPYNNKEMVMVESDYAPQWFYFDENTPGYVIEEIPFGATVPGEWEANNYPSVCTADGGRLMLSGVPSEPESIYGTKVFVWNDLNLSITEPSPEDAIKFATTYRSPVQWMLGQKALAVGAQVMEYAVTSVSGFLSSGDIDAKMQSTHGSAKVQPAGMGQGIAFAAERGRRLRLFQFSRQDQGWIAPDKSILNSAILRRGIRRIVRMRNPHQMIICLMNDGTLSILSEDTYVDVSGWSTININASIKDIAVLPDVDGLDILYCVVDRVVGGVKKTYLEAFTDWADDFTWNYLNSHKVYAFDAPTNVITDLDHLEGQRVQVTSNDGFVGNFRVSGGQITMEDGNGNPQNVSSAAVGLGFSSIAVTLPAAVPETVGGQGAQKRYANIGVRGIFSSRVIINNQRPPERLPFAQMDISQPIDIIGDASVVNTGYDQYATIRIEENLPVRSEIVGIYGTLTVDNV